MLDYFIGKGENDSLLENMRVATQLNATFLIFILAFIFLLVKTPADDNLLKVHNFSFNSVA